MKPRKEAAEYINSGKASEGIEAFVNKDGFHFGKLELRKLMDFIYEGKPEKDEEITTMKNI